MAKGLTDQFTATATYSDGTMTDVTSSATWATDNAAAATVSTGGLVTGVAAGTAYIRASFGGSAVSVLLAITGTPWSAIAFATGPDGKSHIL